ncbi:Hypothetical predicted protein [Paramuricea clavata]|uniref:Uncharacterized protein n=1 Tax=Paramuricea clavata TaxID=317549 RepID=A0A6S7GF17_PARCT|nr:Hypothetical predicted protein [Paramuricea clavata]
MLKPVRVLAGLGNPPNKWTNQQTESLNTIIKEEAGNQVTDQATIHEILEERIFSQQENEYIKAVFNMGNTKVFKAPTSCSEKHPSMIPRKKLSVSIQDSGVVGVPSTMLTQIWNSAEVILSTQSIIDVGKVYENLGNLPKYLKSYNKKSDKASKIIFGNIPIRAGEKPREKKKRKGSNNVELHPIVEEVRRNDIDLDFPKPLNFTEIYHNKNNFDVVFTKDYRNISKCESCKIEFPTGGIVCIPQDIAILHMERYYYPKKDAAANIRMEATWKKEVARYYCMKKNCILQRHPYFWKGMLKIENDVRERLKEGHTKLLNDAFHLSL